MTPRFSRSQRRGLAPSAPAETSALFILLSVNSSFALPVNPVELKIGTEGHSRCQILDQLQRLDGVGWDSGGQPGQNESLDQQLGSMF